MVVSKQTVSGWFDEGVARGAHHMIVVCDTFDHEDYPSYASGDENAADIAKDKYGYPGQKNMQHVMEVYNLKMDKAEQIAESRAFHF